jgi:hypothetical protein
LVTSLTIGCKFLRNLKKCSPLSGLTFYLVSNHILVDELPSYGETVVAANRSDEERWIPPYAEQSSIHLQDLWIPAVVRRFATRAVASLGSEMRKRLGDFGVGTTCHICVGTGKICITNKS